MIIMGNLKIKDSKLYTDVIDPRTPSKPLIEVELPKEIAEEIFDKIINKLESLPEPDDVEKAHKKVRKDYFCGLRNQVNYD